MRRVVCEQDNLLHARAHRDTLVFWTHGSSIHNVLDDLRHCPCVGFGPTRVDDDTFVCGATDVCRGTLKCGEACPSTADGDCAGSLECSKRHAGSNEYVCCHDTYLDGFTDVCRGMLQEGEHCPSTHDNDCAQSLECGQHNAGSAARYRYVTANPFDQFFQIFRTGSAHF